VLAVDDWESMFSIPPQASLQGGVGPGRRCLAHGDVNRAEHCSVGDAWQGVELLATCRAARTPHGALTVLELHVLAGISAVHAAGLGSELGAHARSEVAPLRTKPAEAFSKVRSLAGAPCTDSSERNNLRG
jgi:hypothetical protein